MVSVSHVHRDDVVEYRIFPSFKEDIEDEIQILQALEECLDLYLAHLSPYLVDYIWQSQPFSLQLVGPDTINNTPSHLFGVTHFGDNIEDEWFIVFLLHKLTAAFPGLVASIQDNDGNFLLIEAAYHLPRWLNPETSSNRVFICNGEIHIIPKPKTPAEIVTLPAGVPSVQQALDLIRGGEVVTLADETIRGDINKRISQFPDKVKENWHYTHCHIPARLGVVLRHKPSLIAPAVQAFYQRDPIDLKACRVMKHFAPEDMVMVQVKFTRCLYAQLTQQKFHPDQRSGWKIPAQSNPKYKACDLGMKLAHGFEILCSKCQSSASVNGENDVDGTSGVRWKRYLNSLEEKGYFRGEIEGSKLHTKLLDSAKKFYKETTSTMSGEHSNSAGRQILDILNFQPCDVTAWKDAENNLPPSQDDSWLYLTPEQLDKMLEKAAGNPSMSNTSTTTKCGNSVKEENMDLESVTKGIKTFVDKVSSYQGAEFPRELGEGKDSEVTFDASAFEDALENILSYRRTGPQDDSSDDTDDDDDDDDDDDLDSDDDEDETSFKVDPQMLSLMAQMDQELSGTEVAKSFQSATHDDQSSHTDTTGVSGLHHSANGEDRLGGSHHSANGEERPVDIDVNLLQNIMESYSSQQGLAGPASNILHSMGMHLPQDEDKMA